MILPLFQKRFFDLPLVFHIDDVYHHRLCLEEPITAVHCLDKIVKLIVDPQKDFPVTVPLEITARPGEGFLRGKQPDLSF